MKVTASTLKGFVTRHSDKILIAGGTVMMFGAIALTVPATIKAKAILEKEDKDLTKIEVVQKTWKEFIWPGALAIGSGACFVGANVINTKRATALFSALSVSENAYSKLKDTIKNTVGEEKMEEIQKAVDEDKIKTAASGREVILIEGNGTLFFEPTQNGLIESDVNKIDAVFNDLNRRMNSEMIITLNDMYEALNLNTTEIGDFIGWDVNRDGHIKYHFETRLLGKDKPVMVIVFDNTPTPIRRAW